MRREWIEIDEEGKNESEKKSPSMRREWIEMADSIKRAESRESPSMRREWIEMSLISIIYGSV